MPVRWQLQTPLFFTKKSLRDFFVVD